MCIYLTIVAFCSVCVLQALCICFVAGMDGNCAVMADVVEGVWHDLCVYVLLHA